MMISLRGLGVAANVQSIAQAIATAEGFYNAGPSSLPVVNNNPCDMTSAGALAVYSTLDAGWAACENQINIILNGQSSVPAYAAGPDTSILQLANGWAPPPSASCGSMCAGNSPTAWANNVAAALGVSPTTPLAAISGGSVAQTSTDSTTGLETPITSTDTGDESGLDSTGDSSLFDLNDLSFTDDSGNLTGLGWLAIAGVVGLGVWVLAS